jgi:hypothetical protein
LAQSGDKGLLAQCHGDSALNGLKTLHGPSLTLQDFDHMQTKPAVHQAR